MILHEGRGPGGNVGSPASFSKASKDHHVGHSRNIDVLMRPSFLVANSGLIL